jgi:hypothetical protein
MTAIDHDFHAVQICLTQTLLGVFDVPTAGIVDSVRLTDLDTSKAICLHIIKHFLLHQCLELIGKFIAIRTENL